jgi:hypothetical protein
MTAKTFRSVFVTASLVLAALIIVPSMASAQYREFTGRIDMVKGKKFIVDNRKGDKVRFEFLESTEVTGEKTKVKSLKKKDWVTVSWKFTDNPRKAYKIVVLPPREEEK